MIRDPYPSYFYLTFAAVINFVFAFLHVVVPFNGVTDFIYIGTNKFTLLEMHRSSLPEPAILLLALVFAVFGVYCLSGAEMMRRLPLLDPVLWVIGSIYTLRGLILIPGLLGYTSGDVDSGFQVIISTVAMVVAWFILVGMRKKMIERTVSN